MNKNKCSCKNAQCFQESRPDPRIDGCRLTRCSSFGLSMSRLSEQSMSKGQGNYSLEHLQVPLRHCPGVSRHCYAHPRIRLEVLSLLGICRTESRFQYKSHSNLAQAMSVGMRSCQLGEFPDFHQGDLEWTLLWSDRLLAGAWLGF